MTRKPNRFCFGVVVIFTFAALSFDPGACEPVGYSARASEPPARHGDVERALTTDTWAPRSRGRRQGLGSRQISSSLIKTKETFRDMSEFTDVQAQSREELRPVVECGQDSMTLTVRGTRAVPLRVITGTDSSLALSELPSHCGFSVHKSWREIALVAQYNGCYVTAQNDRHVLPLLWRRTPVRMSCPVSPVKSQSLDGLSQCCSSSGLTISLRDPSMSKEPSWTPLDELFSSEMTGVAPLFHLNSATELYPKPPLLPYAVPQHDVVEKTNFESQKPMHGLPEVYKQHNMDTVDLRMNPNDQKPFGTVPPAGESTPSASPHPPTYTHWPLPYYYLLFYGPKSENDPFPAAAPAPQSANPLLQSDDVQQSFVSDSHSAPELFAPVHDAAEDLMNEGQSTPHSDLSQWGENYVVLPPLMSEDDSVEGKTVLILSFYNIGHRFRWFIYLWGLEVT
uniref:Zona pellucida sperm-binding protein 1/4 Ig-like domain-containing protein n=1 Tax=Periophthalmus magnuspinnatus TaxID=409849 RepID=A0A3B4AWG9_9GOBI